MAASILLMTNGATPATPASGKTIIFINASKQICTVDDAGIAAPWGGGGGTAQSTPGDPTGTTNTTGLMMGLAGSFTPLTSGRMLLTITGNLSSSGTSIGNGGKTQARYGTGSAPANAAALTGTSVGSLVTSVNESTTANTKQPFSVTAVVTGLTVGTAYWLDLSLAQVGAGGTAAVTNLSISAIEF
jgi:hypothetical protein